MIIIAKNKEKTMTKTVEYISKTKRIGDGERPVRVGYIRISLLSCNPKHHEVGVDGFPPLQGTHMRETKYAVTGG